MLLAMIVLYGPPTILAAAPGLVALFTRRWILGALLVLGAIVAIALPEYLDSLRIVQLAAQGVVADDLVFLFLPWMYGIPYAVVSGIFLTAFVALTEQPERNV